MHVKAKQIPQKLYNCQFPAIIIEIYTIFEVSQKMAFSSFTTFRWIAVYMFI